MPRRAPVYEPVDPAPPTPATATPEELCRDGAFDWRGAADFLGNVSEKTVVRLVEKGDIPVVRVGTRVLIPRRALALWLAGKLREATA